MIRAGSKRTGSAKEPSSGFKYKKRSVDDLKKRANQRGGNFDSPVIKDVNMWRPKDGANLIRILPPTWEGYDHYGYEVFMHRFIGADTSNYLCLNKMKGKPCAACDEAKELKDANEDEDARKMGIQKRVWVWIVDRDDKDAEPQIWDMSWSQDRDLAQMCIDDRTGKILLIDHPSEGFDVTVKKSGKGLKTKYVLIVDRESSAIDDDPKEQKRILKYIEEHPIPDIMRFDTNEHLIKQLAGTAKSKDEDLDEDEDETPRRKKSKAREDEDEDETPRRRKKAADDEDEDEDETPRKRKKAPVEDDDEDEDETPRRRGKRAPVEDEEDEDEAPKKRKRAPVEDEDEDEDETPRKRKRAPVEEEEDEDEDEPAPKKRKRAPVEDEDEDEDDEPAPKKKTKRAVVDDDDEEEDEPAPKKKGKRAPVDEDEEEEEERPRRRGR